MESRSASGLRAAINATMDAKKAKLNTPFTKYLAIANPNNGVSFLLEVWSSIPTLVEFFLLTQILMFDCIHLCSDYLFLSCTSDSLQITKHWSVNLTPEMTTEKLQLLATSALPKEEKENLLVLWNKSKQVRLALQFPTAPFRYAVFTMYLHKLVFWY